MTLAFEKTFDSAAEEYDKIRPSYLPAIYEDILQYGGRRWNTGLMTDSLTQVCLSHLSIKSGPGNMMKAGRRRRYPGH